MGAEGQSRGGTTGPPVPRLTGAGLPDARRYGSGKGLPAEDATEGEDGEKAGGDIDPRTEVAEPGAVDCQEGCTDRTEAGHEGGIDSLHI